MIRQYGKVMLDPPSRQERFGGMETARTERAPAVVPMTATVLMLGMHATAMYLYLPVLPALQSMLHTGAVAMQGTLSAAVLAFGMAQLFWGPFADRFGRRCTMLAGAVSFVAASAAMLVTRDIAVFMLCRVVQGIGVAATAVACRAMLRDLLPLSQRAHAFSLAFSWLGVVSLSGPVVAALAFQYGGPIAPLMLVVAFGIVTLGFIMIDVRETRPENPGLPDSDGLRACAAILRDASFIRYTSLTAASYIGHYLFLAGSSYALIVRGGMSSVDYSLILANGSLIHMAGTFRCRAWLGRYGMRQTLRRAGLFTLIGGLSMTGFVLCDGMDPIMIVVSQGIYVFGHAIVQSCGQAAVAECVPERAGTASALSGMILASMAAAIGALCAKAMEVSSVTMAVGAGICGVVCAAIAFGPYHGVAWRTVAAADGR